MQDYGYTEVNDAKRRVQEMKNRTRERAGEDKTAQLSRLIFSLKTQKEKALALSLLYIVNNDSISEDLLSTVIYILFN